MQDQTKQGYQEALDFFNAKKYKKSFLKLIQISVQCSNDSDYLFLLAEVQNQLQDFVARERTLKVLSEMTQKIEHQILFMKQLMNNNSINLALDVGLQLQTQNLARSEKTILYDLLAKIYTLENDFEGLSEVSKLYTDDQILTDQYYYTQSLLNLNQSDEIGALQNLRSAVVKNKNFDQGWVALALLHEKMGDQDLSMANLEKALDVNPMNASALRLYSKKSVHNGTVDKAVDRVKFFLSQYSFDQEMTIQYAELMKSKNQNDIVQRESEKLSYYFEQNISL